MFLKKLIKYTIISLAFINIEAKYIKINTISEYKSATTSGKPIIIMYSASWCQPCQFMKPIFSSLSRVYKDIKFYVVDISTPGLGSLKDQNSISGLPTTVMYDKNNKEIKRERGGLSKQELTNSIEAFIKEINTKSKETKKDKSTTSKSIETKVSLKNDPVIVNDKAKAIVVKSEKKELAKKTDTQKQAPKVGVKKSTVKENKVLINKKEVKKQAQEKPINKKAK